MALSLVNQNRIKLREAFKNSGIAVQEVSEMLYIAFVQNKAQFADKSEQVAKSRKWWNEGDKPPGIKTICFYAAGSDTPDVIVFDASNHEDIRTMIEYWNEVRFEVHPALDLADAFRVQGMKI